MLELDACCFVGVTGSKTIWKLAEEMGRGQKEKEVSSWRLRVG